MRIRGEASQPTAAPRRAVRPAHRLRDERVVERAERPANTLTILGLDFDGLFALTLMTPMLFILQFGSRGAAVLSALTPIYVLIRRDQIARSLPARGFLFIIPALAYLSTLWSTARFETLKYATELLITMIAGLLFSSARNQESVLRGLMLAFLIYVGVSITHGGFVVVGVGAGGEAFAGLTGSKNLMANIASTGLIVSMTVAIISVQRRDWIWLPVAGAAIAAELYCVGAARSAGALVGVAMALVTILGLTPLVYAGRPVRAWITGMTALLIGVMGLNFQVLADGLMGLSAHLLNKDSTLTGRTYLWYRAGDLIRARPVLGRGFHTFWLQGNIDAEGMWRFFGITGRGGFSFHNTFIEILVSLGWAGLIVIGLVVLAGVAALVRRFVQRPTLPLVFWMALLLYQLARTPIETIGIDPFDFSTALMFGALGAAFHRAGARRPLPAPTVVRQPYPFEPFTRRSPSERAPVSLRIRSVKPAP